MYFTQCTATEAHEPNNRNKMNADCVPAYAERPHMYAHLQRMQ